MHARREHAIGELLASDEPSIRWKVRCGVLGEDPASKSLRALGEEIRQSARVRMLLARRDPAGRIVRGRSIYDKWQGAHWILATLADIGYPARDRSLAPVRDQVLDAWLHADVYREFHAKTKADAYKGVGVCVMQGRHRRCASQQGYALYYLIRLGLDDQRVDNLVERLLHWRWPDGGWNCDKEPSAAKSTFIHTIHCLRGLHLYGTRFRDRKAVQAAREASEIFLTRRLFKRRSNGAVMKAEFAKLHYPTYWHYDYLFGLKVMAECGLIGDARCADALDLLERSELREGGWPAQSRYYRTSQSIALGNDFVDWGGVSSRRPNPWVTADALSVLRAAGRLN
jgi:hypothetical protein